MVSNVEAVIVQSRAESVFVEMVVLVVTVSERWFTGNEEKID